jgi:hypothetical protein
MNIRKTKAWLILSTIFETVGEIIVLLSLSFLLSSGLPLLIHQFNVISVSGIGSWIVSWLWLAGSIIKHILLIVDMIRGTKSWQTTQ